MPIKSYLAYPNNGHFDEVVQELSQVPYCEIVPPENNREILVVLSDTTNIQEEDQFQESITSIPQLGQLVLVSAFDA